MESGKITLLYVSLLIIFACRGNFVAVEQSPSLAALSDIAFMHETIRENHPGMHNVQDADFIKTFDHAYQQAMSECANVHDEQQHVDMLKKYTRTFNDSHLQFCPAQNSHQNTSATPDGRIFSIKQVSDAVSWITLPIFDPNQNQKTELIAVIDQLPNLRSQQHIVFDVRGNTGGNSAWSDKIVEALFGNDYATMQKEKIERAVSVDWRVSKDNVAYIKSLVDVVAKEFGTESEASTWICNVYQGTSRALDEGKLYFREEQIGSTKPSTNAGNLCSAKIVVIIDKHCVSACLDFIDYLKALNHPVTLIGETTSADSVYMEVRSVEVPSKIGRLVLPIKVYRNRPRGHNQPYHPDIAYPGDLNDSEKLQSWVTNFVSL